MNKLVSYHEIKSVLNRASPLLKYVYAVTIKLLKTVGSKRMIYKNSWAVASMAWPGAITTGSSGWANQTKRESIITGFCLIPTSLKWEPRIFCL